MAGGRKKWKYRKKIFAYFLAIAIVPLLILGFYSYHSAKTAVRKSVRQANKAALIQIENKVDSVLDSVSQNFFRIAASNQTEKIISQSSDQVSYTELRDFMDDIGQDRAYMDYVNGFTLVNFKNHWVLSNKGMYAIDKIENRDWIDEIRDNSQKVFWVNHGREPEEKLILQEHVNNQYLTLVIKTPAYTQYHDAAFIVNVDQASFENLLSGSLGNSSLTVFDQDGQLVYTENPAISGFYEKNPELIKTVSGAAAGSVSGRGITAEGAGYDIVKLTSDRSGWTFIAGYNPAAVNGELTPILLTMGGTILAILVMIGLISALGAVKVYQPVQELVSSMEGMPLDTQDGDGDRDEFGLINQKIHSLLGRNEKLQGLIDRQRDQLAELFAYRLIRGSLNESEIEQTRTRLCVLQAAYFCVVSSIFCQKEDSGLKEAMEQDVLNLELMRHLPKEIKDMLLLPPFLYTRSIFMVVGSDTKEKMEEKLLALRNCLSVYVTNSCGGYVDMGVSRIFMNTTGFRKAYHESQEALKINEFYERTDEKEGLSLEDSSITYYGDLAKKNSNEAEYNLILDGEIKEAVDSCSKEKAFAVVDQFLRDINRSGAVLYKQHYYLHRFLMTILSVPADAGVPIHELFPEGEDNLFLKFDQLYDYQAVRKFYEIQIIVPVIECLTRFRKSSSEMVLEKIIDLIEACSGDLTLAECAEKLGYHPSYIWRVMKNTKDITFTDYVTEQKMEMAKKLLTQTGLSVTEIAERLNYSNAQNFIRLFKKHMDITPGQYRKMRKSEE